MRALEVARTRSPWAGVKLIVEGLRPARGQSASAHLEALCTYLEGDRQAGEALGEVLRTLIGQAHAYPALTESGVPGTESFLDGLIARIGRRVLPRVPDATDLRDHVRALFDRPDDHLWVARVPDASWKRLLNALGVTAETVDGVGDEVATAARSMAHHVASLGLQPEVIRRLPDLEHDDSPFLALGENVREYLRAFGDAVEGNEEAALERALDNVGRCRTAVSRLRESNARFGTNLAQTGQTFRLRKLLDRLELLLHLGEPEERDFQGCVVRLFKEIVHAEKTRDHVGPHVRASADLLAYAVVEHAARKGAKYITSGRRDYGAFFLASAGGGLIVSIFALVKVVMAQWTVPLGVQALLYGLNYSVCFVLIYLTGAALATKQPAMTANTLARSLGDSREDLEGLSELIVRVWRSQFASFAGNLLVAFPLAMLWSRVFLASTGEPLAPESKAWSMLAGVHPLMSGALFYAGVAGVLLFASGLVAGWVDNWNANHGIRDRVAHHPLATRLFGHDRAPRLADTFDAKVGALAGNVFLGFGLGATGTLGTILGLPLEIRHVAFASAEFGAAIDLLGGAVPLAFALQVALGVSLIGFVNFVVSFGLSLTMALESRQVGFREGRRLGKLLWVRLRRRPLDWFVPPADPPPAAMGQP